MKLRALNMRIPERLAVRLKIKAARRESSVKEIASDALATYLRTRGQGSKRRVTSVPSNPQVGGRGLSRAVLSNRCANEHAGLDRTLGAAARHDPIATDEVG